MARSPSPEVGLIGAADVAALLDLAESTIVTALEGAGPTTPALTELPAPLREPQGVFVSIHVREALNGCMGQVEAEEPVGHAVPRLALSAAFRDPRLPALRPEDLPHTTIEISLLSALVEFPSESRAHLLEQLRPGHDGLVVEAGGHRAVFLPSVWEQLPDPDEFVAHLFHKAGLDPWGWARGTRTHRFTANRHERAIA